MRRLRPQAMQAFSDLRIRVFVDRLVAHVGERFPEKVDGSDGADVRAEVMRHVHKGRRWGLVSEAHATAFTDLSFEWGEGFEEEPERRDVRGILRDRNVDPDEKLRRVRAILDRFAGPDPFEEGEADVADPEPPPSASPALRSDLLRARVRSLDELARRIAAASQGTADPATAAKQAALGQRVDRARSRAAGELARRDRVERLRRDAASAKLRNDREALAKKKAEYREERMKAEEQEKAAGRKEGDVADPCVTPVAFRAGLGGRERAGTKPVSPRPEGRP